LQWGCGPWAYSPQVGAGGGAGRRCRREEEGGDGTPDRGRPRQAPAASSPEIVANLAVEFPGPLPAPGTRPSPASGVEVVGRCLAGLGAGGGSRDARKSRAPPSPPPARACGARGLGGAGSQKCWGGKWDAVNVGPGCGVQLPRERVYRHLRGSC
jgi:hypothetical protein